jgi:hypothetical protein
LGGHRIEDAVHATGQPLRELFLHRAPTRQAVPCAAARDLQHDAAHLQLAQRSGVISAHEIRDCAAHRALVEVVAPLAQLDRHGCRLVSTPFPDGQEQPQQAFLQRRLDAADYPRSSSASR